MPPRHLFGFVRSHSPSLASPLDEAKARQTSPLRAEESKTGTMEHIKRPSITVLAHKGKTRDPSRSSVDEKRKTSSGTPPAAVSGPGRLDMIIESPPLVFYGPSNNSTGALMSGQLRLSVTRSEIEITSFEMRFLAVVRNRRPIQHRCPDCETKTSELCKWTFLRERRKFNAGQQSFPFSYLLPGHLPGTTHATITDVDYKFSAKATTSTGEMITLTRPINVQRAIMPGQIKTSLRVFPPTTVTAAVLIPPIIYPIGEFPVEMRLDGIVQKQFERGVAVRWRLRKMTWNIQEIEKAISPACAKHAHKVGGEGRGIAHEDSRSIGSGEIKEGCKTDWDAGTIELEFRAAINTSLRPSCDVEAENGLKVTHSFVVEMVVAEEWAPLKKPNSATPTGAARVMRMQFNVVVTERSGLGISWDEEQPPVYDDVPPSPPHYAHTMDYRGSPLTPLTTVREGRIGGGNGGGPATRDGDVTGLRLGPSRLAEEVDLAELGNRGQGV